MKITEHRLKVYILQSIDFKHVSEQLSKLLDSCLIQEQLESVHESNKIKGYTFNGLYPVEQDKIYSKGNIYTVVIRSINEQVNIAFRNKLDNQTNQYFKALTVETREIRQKHIDKIFSLTPIIIKFRDEGYWRESHSKEEFEQRLKVGLIKKYNTIYETKIDEDFEWIYGLKIDNHKPIATAYKGKQLLGDKITLRIADNEIAQKLAWLAVGTGIGEMNARGYGNVNFRYL